LNFNSKLVKIGVSNWVQKLLKLNRFLFFVILKYTSLLFPPFCFIRRRNTFTLIFVIFFKMIQNHFCVGSGFFDIFGHSVVQSIAELTIISVLSFLRYYDNTVTMLHDTLVKRDFNKLAYWNINHRIGYLQKRLNRWKKYMLC
jgi:hypothetical protein